MMNAVREKGGSLRQWMARGAICAAFAFGAGQAGAVPLTLDFSGDNVYSPLNTPTGASARVSLDFTDVGNDVQIQFTMQNTTGDTPFGAGATESRFTGFALDLVSGLSLISTGPTWVSGRATAADTLLTSVFVGGLSNGAGGAGRFDFGIADNSRFVGGRAGGGLRSGKSVVVSLLFDTLDTAAGVMAAYADALFDPASGVNAAVRFQKIKGDAQYSGKMNDRLLFSPNLAAQGSAVVSPVPLPAALPLLVGALGGLGFAARRRRKA